MTISSQADYLDQLEANIPPITETNEPWGYVRKALECVHWILKHERADANALIRELGVHPDKRNALAQAIGEILRDAHAGGATVSESHFCAFEDCDTTVEREGDCCPKHLEPDESCRRGVHVWYYGEGHETIGICKWCGAYESAISKSETTQPATGDGTGEDEGDDSCPRDGLGHHTWSRRCNDCGEVRADRSEKLDRALRAALSDIEHLGQEKTALKEKLAAAETAYASMTESHRSAMQSVELCTRERQEAEQRAETAEARVAAWEPTIVAAIEQTETSFFFEGARIRHCSEKFWPAVKAIPAEHRPEVKP